MDCKFRTALHKAPHRSGVDYTWSVGSQACRQSSAALQVGSDTHANICGPHLLTMLTNVAKSCTYSAARSATTGRKQASEVAC